MNNLLPFPCGERVGVRALAEHPVEKFGAKQALAWGLVTRVHPPETLFAETLAAARSLAAAPEFACGGGT